jgi:hypothetical protein
MSNRLRRFVALTAAILMLMTTFATTASADSVAQGDSANASPAVDSIVLRVTGMLSLVAGTGLFLIATPFVLVTRPHEIGRPFKQLVVRPAKYVWADPIGGH